jgi:hypothetical protein
LAAAGLGGGGAAAAGAGPAAAGGSAAFGAAAPASPIATIATFVPGVTVSPSLAKIYITSIILRERPGSVGFVADKYACINV